MFSKCNKVQLLCDFKLTTTYKDLERGTFSGHISFGD